MKTHFFDFLFLSLICSFSFLSLELEASAATSSTRDAQNLIGFKNALMNSTALKDWLPNLSPCSFHGVKCEEETNRVSSLDLSSVSLNTDFHTVAAFLFSLEKLESLSLNSANISGTISFPPGSKCSGVLSSLDLSQNALSGSVSDIASLGVCPSLKSLNLSSNSLDFSPKGDKSGGLKLSFKSLDLSFNKIVAPNVVPFVLSGGCTELVHLSLKGNKVSGDMAAIATCNNLQFLDLSSNNFSVSIPSLGDCVNLEHLDISSNKFTGDLSRAIGSCGSLNFINVSSNQFSGPLPAVPTGKLRYLYMGENHFEGEIPLHLVDSCPSLIELDLSSNNLTGSVPSGFVSCTSLESLDISVNKFSGELPIDTLLEMSSLKAIDFSYNSFAGGLPESFSKLTTLETLDVSANNLSGLIPANLCGDPRNNLKQLFLQDNLFTGSIPASLSNCSQLTSLHLSFNYLTGTIPPSLGSLSNLRDLKLWFNQLTGEIPREITNIRTLETLILDFNELTGVIPASISNCSQLNWISLSNNRLTGEIPASIGKLLTLAILKLSNNSFYGRIPPELGDCKSLIWLDLNTNFLNGTIPRELFKQSGTIAVNFITGKKYAYLKNLKSDKCHGEGNLLEYAGIRQGQLGKIITRHPCNFTQVYKGLTQPTFNDNGSMIFLDLSYNSLSGSIPKEIGTMTYLYVLNLGHNKISGTIPEEFGNLEDLNILNLSNNELEGVIPQSMTRLSLLTEIDMSNNKLTGTIPDTGQFETFQASSFANNAGLCGIPLSLCGAAGGAGANSEHRKSHKRQASLVGSVAMGLLFALFCIFAVVIVIVEMKKRRKKKDPVLDLYIENHSNSGRGNTTGWKITGTREQLSINLTTFEKPLRKLTFADLLDATNGFHNDNLIGSGGFGDVYKAELKDGSVVAIKKLIHISGQGDREFTAEMETIGKIKHRNLVPLLGYCKVGEERLLVYEYMKFGSLEDVLHNPKKSGITLNWSARRKIAIGAARGLAFLHHNCIPHIIHRDMKSSNVLLDENLEARVSDFGMARLMNAADTHLSVSTLAGTPGYVPPEYYQSFRCTTKGDVYSYGVVLLELLTGKRPTDSADFGDNNLVGWVKQHAKLKITDVFDPVLMKEDPNLKIELLRHLEVACACLDDRPLRRPTMIQVMAMFKEIQAGSGLDSQSTIVTDDGGFCSVQMTIKEDPEKQ